MAIHPARIPATAAGRQEPRAPRPRPRRPRRRLGLVSVAVHGLFVALVRLSSHSYRGFARAVASDKISPDVVVELLPHGDGAVVGGEFAAGEAAALEEDEIDDAVVAGAVLEDQEEDGVGEEEGDEDDGYGYDAIDYSSFLSANEENLTEAARLATQAMSQSVSSRLEVLFRQARSTECRALIAEHLGYFVQGLGKEHAMPFSEWQLESDCPEPALDWDHLPEGMHIGHVQNKSYQPEDAFYKNASDLRILYGVLTHDDANATIRLLSVLNDTNVNYVVHVDGKHDETQQALVEFARSHRNVHVLPDERRVRINWGGFTMVNATLQMLQYALLEPPPVNETLDFDKFVHLASTSYPLASNREIKEKLAQFPVDANLVYAVMKPARPKPWGWHYFVECDDRLHRIHRLSPWQNATHGIDLYTSSQWFMLSREFALYLASPPPGSFVEHFAQYARHVVVADETYFGTALIHSPYCAKHHNGNFLHLQFDRWESVLPQEKRDPKKCMMLDPDHCGRSPTVMTIDYVDLLELSPDLFARKFVDTVDGRVKDIVDRWRLRREADPTYQSRTLRRVDFEGHGVMIVAKDTVHDEVPLCLGLGETGNAVKLVPCFYEDVLPSLVKDWATGAVISDEVMLQNRWEVGPCTSDGHVERLPTGEINSTTGDYSITGPRCLLKQMDGIRAGRCVDIDSRTVQPGGAAQVFPCVNKWFQFVSFGDGNAAPKGSVYSTIPSHIVKQIHNLGHDHISHMCLGVYGRGLKDEVEWSDEERSDNNASGENRTTDGDQVGWKPLSAFHNQNIITTQCSNEGAVIQWLFVPFVVEEAPTDEESQHRDALLEEHSRLESVADRNDSVRDLEKAGATLAHINKVDGDDARSTKDPMEGPMSTVEHPGTSSLARSDLPGIPAADDGTEEL